MDKEWLGTTFLPRQAATMQQKIKEQETEIKIVERKQQIEIAEQEIQRKERELDSKVSESLIHHSLQLYTV